jgi:hypothetical protein
VAFPPWSLARPKRPSEPGEDISWRAFWLLVAGLLVVGFGVSAAIMALVS